jgi:phage gp36-like protein
MRETIKAALVETAKKFELQVRSELVDSANDSFLDYKALGVAAFVKEIAYAHDDLELLAIASRLEMQVEKSIEAENTAEYEFHETQMREYEYRIQISEMCHRYSHSELAPLIDMSKYQQMVENSAPGFSDSSRLSALLKYVDPEEVLRKVISRMEGELWRNSVCDQKMPVLEDILKVFHSELSAIYRLADGHVSRVIARYGNAG